jgi:hypothetical protein
MTSEERAARANAGNYLSESELVNAIAQEIDDAVAEECVELREQVARLKVMNREGLSAMAEVADLRELRDGQEIAVAVLRKEREIRFKDLQEAKASLASLTEEVELLREVAESAGMYVLAHEGMRSRFQTAVLAEAYELCAKSLYAALDTARKEMK